MPATYAHFRFGREVLRRLSPETREAIAPRIQLYHIGLHGPDIFFYYHPLSKNPVQALGGQLHLLSGREIFTRMEAVRDRYPADSRRGLEAYIFGFICHYALDSSAHGTVHKGIKETGVSHTAIESDFDRALLLEDGFEPAGQPLAGHIVPSVGNAAVISRFFPTVTAKEVEKSLSSMRFFHSLLLAPGKGKRGLLGLGLSAAGKAESIGGMIVRPDPNPACAAVTETLREKFEEGLPLAVQLIETAFTPGWLSDGRMELDFESETAKEFRK